MATFATISLPSSARMNDSALPQATCSWPMPVVPRTIGNETQTHMPGHPTSWTNEDHVFTRSVAEGKPVSFQRALYLYRLAWFLIEKGPWLPYRSEWEEEAVALVEGFIDEGLWVWAHGDERYLEDHWKTNNDRMSQSVMRRIAGALDRRVPGQPNKLLAKSRNIGNPAIRCGIICWFVFKSETAKRFDFRRGWTQRARWESPVERWHRGCLGLSDTVCNELAAEADELSLYETFADAMVVRGHNCHVLQYTCWIRDLKIWLLVRYYLWPNQKDQAIFLQDLWDEDRVKERGCSECVKTAQSLDHYVTTENVQDQPKHPRCIVLLAILSRWCAKDLQLSPDLWGLHQQIPLPFQPLTLGIVEATLANLSVEPPSLAYGPWVNTLPLHWRDVIPARCPSFWDQLERCFALEPICPPTSDFDVRGWMAAAMLLLNGSGSRFHPADVVGVVKKLEDGSKCYPLKCLQEVLLSGFPLNDASARFETSIRGSYHTCWDCVDSTLLQWYASTMVSLLGNVDIPVIGCYSDQPGGCLACDLEIRFKPGMLGDSSSYKTSVLASRILHILKSPHDSLGNLGDNSIHPTSPKFFDIPFKLKDAEHVSTHKVAPALGKSVLVRQIKAFFLYLLEHHGIFLDSIKPHLPWTTLPRILSDHNLELANWPSGIAMPGEGANDHKGVNGLPTRDLKRIYDAMYPPDGCEALGFRSKSESRSESQQGKRKREDNEEESTSQTPTLRKHIRVIEWSIR